MANFTWTNAAGGDWSVASNWSLGGVIPAPRPPGAGDTAFFGNLANSYTVTVEAGTTVGDSDRRPLYRNRRHSVDRRPGVFHQWLADG